VQDSWWPGLVRPRGGNAVCFKAKGGKACKIPRQTAKFANAFTRLRLFKGRREK